MLLGRDLRNQYKIPKNSILARNFSLSQGNKDKSCPGQEIRGTRIRFQSWQRRRLRINYPCMLCMKIANNSPLFPDFRFQIYYSKVIFDFKFITQSSFAISVKTCHKKVTIFLQSWKRYEKKSLLESKCKIWFAQTKEEHGEQVFDYRNHLWLGDAELKFNALGILGQVFASQ